MSGGLEDILIFFWGGEGVFKGPTLGPLGKHKCQGLFFWGGGGGYSLASLLYSTANASWHP